MKKLAFLVLLVLAVSEILSAQGRPPYFNEAWLIKDKSSWLASTANDTIPQPGSAGAATFFTLSTSATGGRSAASDLVFFARTNDSTTIRVLYQLQNSQIGSSSRTGWTEIDTVITVDDAGASTDTTIALGRLALATISGYDQIRFYEDFLSGTATTAAGDGSATRLRYYLYLLKNENIRR